MNSDWLTQPYSKLNIVARTVALERQGRLTKPSGSLGQLEELAARLAEMQSEERPSVDHASIAIFAADHGVAAENVSAFPQMITGERVKNFALGGSAICVQAKMLNAKLELVNLGTVNDPGEWSNVVRAIIAPSTANIAKEAAMTETQLAQALQAGRESVFRAIKNDAQIYIGGEMSLANTTAAAALGCALLKVAPHELVGAASGLAPAGVMHKIAILERTLALHADHLDSPLECIRRVGGFEIAALTAAYLTCAQLGLPVLVDGFTTTVAALVAVRIAPQCADWLIYAHCSAEPGHAHLLQALNAQPLLNIGMRLGEGSGAATALPLLRMACALHNGMATIADAAVSGKI
jgi:nicotinate-nucleotide--dimethylbenzimidazole phosphoribosyltransferase